MPNHVTHRCVITGLESDIASFVKRAIKSEDEGGEIRKCLDFNAFIPCPPELKQGEDATDVTTALFALGYERGYGESKGRSLAFNMLMSSISNPLCYPWVVEKGIRTREQLLAYLEANRPDQIDGAKRAIELTEKYGYSSWYGWCIDNWGTKWNSYSFEDISREDGRYEFTFDTAWNVPMPVLKKVASEFPKLLFGIMYFDEGYNFAGKITMMEGELWDQSVEPTDSFYEEVYGCKPGSDDDDE